MPQPGLGASQTGRQPGVGRSRDHRAVEIGRFAQLAARGERRDPAALGVLGPADQDIGLPGRPERNSRVVARQPGEGLRRRVELLFALGLRQRTQRAGPGELVLTEQPQRCRVVAELGRPLELGAGLGPPIGAVGGGQEGQVELDVAAGGRRPHPVQDRVRGRRGHVVSRVGQVPPMGRLQDQQDGQVVDLGRPAPDQAGRQGVRDQRIERGELEGVETVPAQPIGVGAAEHGTDPRQLGDRRASAQFRPWPHRERPGWGARRPSGRSAARRRRRGRPAPPEGRAASSGRSPEWAPAQPPGRHRSGRMRTTRPDRYRPGSTARVR